MELTDNDIKNFNSLTNDWKTSILKVLNSLQLTKFDDFIRYDFLTIEKTKLNDEKYYSKLCTIAKENIVDLNMQKYYSLFLISQLQKAEIVCFANTIQKKSKVQN